jgi:sortase A
MMKPAPTRSVLRWSPHFFFAIAILALGYVGVTLLQARLYQAREARNFEQARQAQISERSSAAGQTPESPPLPPQVSQPDIAAAEGHKASGAHSPLGRIEIASIGLSTMVMEGIDSAALRLGVGHIPGTALPGQPGNVALAGHRDTFFRGLRNIHQGDEILLETLNGSYRYRVELTRVVAADDVEALKSSGEATLTLVTCYPFYFVGPAPRRYIVRAGRILP